MPFRRKKQEELEAPDYDDDEDEEGNYREEDEGEDEMETAPAKPLVRKKIKLKYMPVHQAEFIGIQDTETGKVLSLGTQEGLSVVLSKILNELWGINKKL